ncbi:MAG: fumarylacetoacetase [Pseudomonadota bacterium]
MTSQPPSPRAVPGANDPALRSFIEVQADSHFPIQNLPFGIFSLDENGPGALRRAGVAIGDQVLDLRFLRDQGLLDAPPKLFDQPDLNAFLAAGRPVWRAVRERVSVLLRADNPELRDHAMRERALHPIGSVKLHMPVLCSGFSDFMLSKEHARNCIDIVGGTNDGQFWPNWHHFPMGYNSRASSVVVSQTPVRRPWGQIKPRDEALPQLGVCQQLDFELETALVVGKPNVLGRPISLHEVPEHAFGVVLLNDWSARDIQQWEAQPLGVFNSKNFSTSISPWIVTLDALEPFRVDGPMQEPQPLAYLRHAGKGNIRAHMQAWIQPQDHNKPSVVCSSELGDLYWNFDQQLVHQTSAGCNVNPGDLLGSGTVSSSGSDSLACLFEKTRDGRERFNLEHGGQRLYLEDGDEVTLTGWCQGEGYRVGFGQCVGRVLPALEVFPQG